MMGSRQTQREAQGREFHAEGAHVLWYRGRRGRGRSENSKKSSLVQASPDLWVHSQPTGQVLNSRLLVPVIPSLDSQAFLVLDRQLTSGDLDGCVCSTVDSGFCLTASLGLYAAGS